jgi:hypothetical protein
MVLFDCRVKLNGTGDKIGVRIKRMLSRAILEKSALVKRRVLILFKGERSQTDLVCLS